jgi:hypothetical protein
MATEVRHLQILADFEYEDRSSSNPPLKRSFREGEIISRGDPLFDELLNVRGWVRAGVPNYLTEPIDYLA